MFSAFSFGKVIKTILPGSILAGGLILLAEALWRWSVSGESLLARLASKEWLTGVTAALVPVSMILGFLLNTWVWLFFNPRMRRQVDGELSKTIFPEIRKRLSADLWKNIRSYIEESGKTLNQVENPARESLEYFYLPVVSLDRLNYLWESYFSWYEFQINTAFAIALSTPFALFLLWVRTHEQSTALFLKIAAGLVIVVVFLFRWLWKAAKENRKEYEKDLMLLIAGSLAAAKKGAASGADGQPSS
jgi:hypothetical protein